MKVLVSVPVNPFTGYGNDGIALIRALLRWGVDVSLQPSGVHPPLPREVAAVLTKPIPDHVDLHISHRCPQELAHPASVGLRSSATVTLAWSMHEWDSLSNIDEINDSNCEHAFSVKDHLQESLTRFDAVLAYDEVSAQAFAPYHDNIAVLQGGVEPVSEMARDWTASPFRFLMLGALSSRKNPWAAIEAFKMLRADNKMPDAELVLKTTAPSLHPAMERWLPGLKILTGIFTEAEVLDLYRRSHVLLAPSWGEGKNIPAAQFAMSGGAVIAPRLGGHAQWMSPDYSYPLPYDLAVYSAGARGAKVDPAVLAEAMLAAYDDRAGAAKRGRTAAQVLPSMMSWDAVLERLMFRLPELVAGARGAEVSALMRACRRPAESDMAAASRQLAALDPA